MRRLLVMAGNHDDFRRWVLAHPEAVGDLAPRYLTQPDSLVGQTRETALVVRLPGWADYPGYATVLRYARSHGIEVRDAS
jgi:hypothetical protein